MNTARNVVFLLVLSLTTASIAAAATVRAVVDRTRALAGESIALQIIIEGGDGEVDLRGLTDVDLLSRGTSSSFQMTNGRISRQKIHNYALIPLKTGNLTIPAIPVTVDGQVYRTRPIDLVVTEEPPVDSGRRDVYVTAEVSDTAPWIGQPLTYTVRLFNAVQVADAKFQPPAFDGFTAEQAKDQTSHRTVINGREFMVSEVLTVLVPIKSGPLTIEPAVLQVGLVGRSRRPDPFSGMDAFFGRSERTTRILETEPLTVEVRDLPPLPPGTTFSGLVGQFEVNAELDKTIVDVGDATTLAVTIRGNGNIMDAAAPSVPVPKAFKSYADSPEESIQVGASGYSGSKTFRTALVPLEPGNHRVDPIMLTYFDVKQARYRTLTTDGFAVKTPPTQTAQTDPQVYRAAPTQPPPDKSRVAFTGRDILPLKTSLDAIQPERRLSIGWFGLLLLVPFLGFAATAAVMRWRAKDDSPGRIMADKAKQALKSASAADNTDADFLSALYRALVSAIYSRRGTTGAALTWSEAENVLIELGWTATEAIQTAGLLETVESLNYSGQALPRQRRELLLEQTRTAVANLLK